MTMDSPGDSRRVVLIKSLATNNRFYTLVEPERGIRNADMVAQIPDDLVLGIAYPCLEDGLNDFAVIRTTFETLDLFPADDPIREEMMEIINDARNNLTKRLTELRDKIRDNRAHFLGTDYEEFKSYSLDIAKRGYPRRNLDSMMKLDVFLSVAEAEGHKNSRELDYQYEFSHGLTTKIASELPARGFIVALFEDVLRDVLDDSNYRSKYYFDRNVFQKFIAVMFVNYATTDSIFYGIDKRDYGVSGEKAMDTTPLYIAIGKELREIEQKLRSHVDPHLPELPGMVEAAPPQPIMPATPGITNFDANQPNGAEEYAGRLSFDEASNLLPSDLVNEEMLMGTLTSLCSAASLLMRKNDPETQRFARVIMADASQLVQQLKSLGIISAFANDPGACD